jgi:transposase
MIQRMAGPESITATALAEETGVSQPTLSRWMADARNLKGMNKKSNKKTPTPQDKLRIIAEASQLADEELGAYLRKEGVHEATLLQWQEAATLGLTSLSRAQNKKKSAETKRIGKLERELLRKDKALAELAALITLQKKAQAIWGDEDGPTRKRNES